MKSKLDALLERAARSSDLVLAVAMAAILGAMIVPLPAWLLDLCLALNLAISVTLLVAALFARDALRVASFPTLLLLTTLFRLALNVSSTRLALSDGHAGDVIEAFGDFVVRGDYVVGAVIFLILTMVQFLVVAKGAERVAEVSARFTLDAMPGKQMSIDADLRAGAIDQTQARMRRRGLERESQMFGAMDGAMKFVKGDVIAGFIIVGVNLVGGTILGVLQHDQRVAEAAATYALIAIGDGLVSQLPSLLITVAAGIVVTRVSAEDEEHSLGQQISTQFFGQYRALGVAAGICGGLALLPGMPVMVFLSLSTLLAVASYVLRGRARRRKIEPMPDAVPSAAASPPAAGPADPAAALGMLTLELGPGLEPLVHRKDGAFVTRDLNRVRDEVLAELGVRVPGFQVRVGARHLSSGHYALLVDEVPAGTGEVVLDALYAEAVPAEVAYLQVEAVPVLHPATGKSISRVSVDAKAVLEAAGVRVHTPEALVADHAAALVRRHAALLLGLQEVQGLLDSLDATHPALVKEALGKVPLPLLTDVLRRLLSEHLSIRNLRVILEALVAPQTEGDAGALAERCRQALSRYLSHKYAPSGPLFAYLLDPAIEEVLRAEETAMDPRQVGDILEAMAKVASTGASAVVLTAPDVRRKLRKLCEASCPELAVLTYAELESGVSVRPVGKITPGRAWR